MHWSKTRSKMTNTCEKPPSVWNWGNEAVAILRPLDTFRAINSDNVLTIFRFLDRKFVKSSLFIFVPWGTVNVIGQKSVRCGHVMSAENHNKIKKLNTRETDVKVNYPKRLKFQRCLPMSSWSKSHVNENDKNESETRFRNQVAPTSGPGPLG